IEEFTLHQWKPFLIDDRAGRQSLHGRTYEWPFEFLVPGNQRESFRGCRRCRLAYRIEASTADGASINTRSYVPIRIARCPPISSYELMDPLTTSGKWAGSIDFSASILHQAIPLGGLIPVEAHINNLDPGMLITKARFYLREIHVAHTNSSEPDPEYMQRIVTEWSLNTCGDFKQSYAWQQCLDLPRVVSQCSPDFNVCGVSMSHMLHFAATIVKDGAELEYDTFMPVVLFVSPDLPITGWDIFAHNDGKTRKELLPLLSMGMQAPPEYCKYDYGARVSVADTPPPAYTECAI
ncbi:hypothetical protein S7711_09531, partial [Stachybotrys chartarum IBT 7711]